MNLNFIIKFRTISCLIFCLLASSATKAQWSTVGSVAFSPGDALNTSIAIGANDTPYIAFRDAANSYKQSVMKYNGSSWVVVGSYGISAGNSSGGCIDINSAGVPYLGYSDGVNAGLTVNSYNGSTWPVVGTAGFSGFSSSKQVLKIGQNDTPFVVFDYNNTFLARVMKYNGSSWVNVGGAISNAVATNTDLVFDSNYIPYVVFNDANNSNKATVKKYIGGSWTVVGSAGFSAGAVTNLSLAISANDTLYLSYQDGGNSNKLTVMKFNGSSWVAVGGAGVTTSDVYATSMQIINEQLYVAYCDGANSYGLSVLTYNGSSWSYLGGSGGVSAGLAWDLDMAQSTAGDLYVSYQDYGNGNDATVMKYDIPITSTTWNGSTWSNGAPTSSLDAIIASSTTPGAFTCKDLTINSTFSLTLGSSVTATIHGDMTNSGNGISGASNLTFAKSGAASLSGTAFSVAGVVTVNSGCTLTTNDKLTLSSDASNTGSIGNSAGTISGNVTVQRYIPGKRCFRFLGHPFTSAQALTTLTDDIDITGTGGSTNGFTTTTTNNPSAFWFDVSAADNSTSGANPGWTAFTHTNGVSANSWDQYELLRVLIRGAKTEGLSGGTYSPSNNTLDMTGVVNQGTHVITLTKGSNSEFVACGNPYPSPIQTITVSRGSNIGSAYYVWDATAGAAGAYMTNPWIVPNTIAAYTAFITTTTANTNNTLTFQEAHKVPTAPSLFKTTAPANWVELILEDSSSLKWDRLLINLEDNAMDVQDKQDAKKLYNPGLDFFTLSKDDVRLAIDARPYTDNAGIPLGLTAYNRYNRYKIKTGMFDIPAGTKLFLHDKYLNKKEEMKAGFEYVFDVTTDTLSQGNQRFEINMVGKPTGIEEVVTNTAKMHLIPNPAQNQVKVSFDKLEGEVQIKMMSVTGQVVYQTTSGTQTGSVSIPLQNIPAGIYIVELQSNNARFTEKLIKE